MAETMKPDHIEPSNSSPGDGKESESCQIKEQGEDLNARKKKRLRKDLNSIEKRGICYLSRVPHRMNPGSLRQILSKYGDIHRIYLVPEGPNVQVQQKQAGRFGGTTFLEGWVEFTKKSIAKMVARMLNGEQIGGRRRSSFFYDIWNIKYLSQFKWDDLTDEIAKKNQTREQKLAMEISAAKRERDFYRTKVDQSRGLKFMKERIEKKQKTQQTSSSGEEAADVLLKHKVVRQFPQNKALSEDGPQRKSRLSRDLLAQVFVGCLQT